MRRETQFVVDAVESVDTLLTVMRISVDERGLAGVRMDVCLFVFS